MVFRPTNKATVDVESVLAVVDTYREVLHPVRLCPVVYLVVFDEFEESFEACKRELRTVTFVRLHEDCAWRKGLDGESPDSDADIFFETREKVECDQRTADSSG